MPTVKTIDERILELQEKQAQLKQREKQLKAKQSQDNRKRDTHRKIVIGGTVESVLGRAIDEKDIPKFIAFLNAQEERGHFFSKALGYYQPEEQPKDDKITENE